MVLRKLMLLLIFLAIPIAFATSYYYKVINPNEYQLTDYQLRIDLNSVNPGLVGQPIAQITNLDTGQTLVFCYENDVGECGSDVTSTGVIWVKIDSLPARDYTILKIDFDGSTNGATTGDNVFIFYDDFNDGTLDSGKWIGEYISESGGSVTLNPTASEWGYIQSIPTFDHPIKIEYKILSHTDYVRFLVGLKSLDYRYDDGGSTWWGLYFNGNHVSSVGYDVPSNGLVGISYVAISYDKFILEDPSDNTPFTFGYGLNDGPTDTHLYLASWADSWTKIDWIRVRTYADQDPIIQSAYSQSSSSPQTATSQTTTFEQTYGYVKVKYVAGLNPTVITDVAIPIVVDTQTWINEGKLQSDCSDLYITYYDPVDGVEKPASFFIDKTTCNTDKTIIYVKLPQIASDQDVQLFIYHGVPGTALPYEDPKNTFYYFVDLSNPTDVNNNLDIYSTGTSSYEITSSGIHITTGSDGYVAIYNK